ncbi:MAG: alpha-glucan family phosphorylase [Bacteroidia bacterium]
MKDEPIPAFHPNLLFEVSWEVAHKVGGIHTVLVGKAPLLQQQWNGLYLLIGPYLPQENSGWTPDPTLYAEWRAYFQQRYNLSVYAGYWHIGEARLPTLLIDFYPAIAQKDAIFASWWEKFGVESLWGGWDYIEPAIFGYVAGQVIQSFREFYYGDVETLAHFHEWLTGGGILYLKAHAPTVATLFTTHATVAGRAAGGELIPRDQLWNWLRARNLLSKHTLEQAAWQQADAVTTVSPQISQEALHYLGRAADLITPNGWNPPSNLPVAAAREWLDRLSQAWGCSPQTFWLLHSGRPELENKGTLALLEALRLYQQNPLPDQTLAVILALPAAHEGPAGPPTKPLWISHKLLQPQENPLCRLLENWEFTRPQSLRLAYIPVYLEGQDGVVNLPYYALLGAVDASAFPSRYEPWGYTPQESLGMGTPTLSSQQAGFGQWMQAHLKSPSEALTLIDYGQPDVPRQILNWLYRQLQISPSQRPALRQEAQRLAEFTRWIHFLPFYQRAYQLAQTKAQARLWQRLTPLQTTEKKTFIWHRAFFLPSLPEELKPLRSLAYNLWWSWNADAQQLFRLIDLPNWERYENPVWLLNHTPQRRWQELVQDEEFLRLFRQVLQRFQTYMAAPLKAHRPRVAYLCLEYGLAKCLPFYAGGLGVLAGDYLKEASDQGYPLLAIGLLYRQGYFTQRISAQGEQVAETSNLRFTDLPLEPVRQPDGRWLRLKLTFGPTPIFLKVWVVHVGRVPLYLLDADLSENPPEVRTITAQLYTGNPETRLLQELVLGFGTQALIEALPAQVDVFHYNEGHAAFHLLAYWLGRRRKGLPLETAQLETRTCVLFTTHTPVPAGHEAISPEHLRTHLHSSLLQELGISWETLLEWGRMPDQPTKFSLTAFCLRFCARTNAVSQLHARVSQRMFASLYPGYLAVEVPVKGITNGIHLSSWQAPEWSQSTCPWETHQTLKRALLSYLRRRLYAHAGPVAYLEALQAFLSETDEETLLLGFARRFATYKRHLLLFQYEGLARLFAEAPVRLILAGKAHPSDEAGKAALKAAWQKALEPPFKGKVLFIPDYDMQLARYLVQGVDVWLNLPICGLEASGTSGMKAALNGVLHVSMPDGWWAEVEAEAAGGWTVPACTTEDAAIRDAWEAAQLAYLLREEVLPLFRRRNAQGKPTEWTQRMAKTQTYIRHHFSTQRMLGQYETLFYQPMTETRRALTPERQAYLLNLRQKLQKSWDAIRVKRLSLPPFAEKPYPAEAAFSVEAEVELGDLPEEALGVELVLVSSEEEVLTFPLSSTAPGLYQGTVEIRDAGVYQYALRLFARNPFSQERLWEWVKLI